jgi:hypothetical protein
MKVWFIKTLGGLRPVDKCRAYDKLEVGEQAEIDIKIVRNYKFHKKFMAMVKVCYDNQEQYNNFDKLRKDLIKSAGFYHDETNFITGEVTQEPDSISFSSMDDTEFEKVYNRVLDEILKFLGCERKDLVDELLMFG